MSGQANLGTQSELNTEDPVVDTITNYAQAMRKQRQRTTPSRRQAATGIASPIVKEITGMMVSTHEAVDLLNLHHLETQPILDTALSYEEDCEQDTSQFETEGKQRLRDRVSELKADIEDLRAICHRIHEQFEDAIKRHERIQGELQDEIHDNARETRQQVTAYVERMIHQHMESFISQMEHKDTTFRIAILKTLYRQRNLMFLMFVLAMLMSASFFFLGQR